MDDIGRFVNLLLAGIALIAGGGFGLQRNQRVVDQQRIEGLRADVDIRDKRILFLETEARRLATAHRADIVVLESQMAELKVVHTSELTRNQAQIVQLENDVETLGRMVRKEADWVAVGEQVEELHRQVTILGRHVENHHEVSEVQWERIEEGMSEIRTAIARRPHE